MEKKTNKQEIVAILEEHAKVNSITFPVYDMDTLDSLMIGGEFPQGDVSGIYIESRGKEYGDYWTEASYYSDAIAKQIVLDSGVNYHHETLESVADMIIRYQEEAITLEERLKKIV